MSHDAMPSENSTHIGRLRRKRVQSACWMAGTIVLGLLSRRYAAMLPWWLAKNAGDVLYATMSYWLMGFLFPSLSTVRVFGAAVAFCFLIEFSQLVQSGWLPALRRARFGALVLGSGFHAGDLVCYVLGALLGCGIDFQSRQWQADSNKVRKEDAR